MGIKNSSILAIASLALLAAMTVGAAEAPNEDANLYKDLKAMDQNHDNSVTTGEYRAALPGRANVSPGDFKRLDLNADGKLSKSEAGVDLELAKHFAREDTNGDGFVTADELRQPTPAE